MLLVAKERSSISGPSKLIAEITLHMHRPAAQEAGLDNSSHPSRHMAELIIMPYGYFELSFVRECNQFSGVVLAKCKWLPQIHVASPFQAELRNIEMAFRRHCDVNNVWLGVSQEFRQVAKPLFDRKPLVELARHQRFPITDSNDLGPFDPLDLRRVRICDLAASHDSDPKHIVFRPGSFRNSASSPQPWVPAASTPPAASIFRCCNKFSSKRSSISFD